MGWPYPVVLLLLLSLNNTCGEWKCTQMIPLMRNEAGRESFDPSIPQGDRKV